MEKGISLSDALRESFRIFKNHFAKIVILVLLVIVPLGIIGSVTANFLQQDEKFKKLYDTLSSDQASAGDIYDAAQSVAGNIVPFLLILLLVSLLSLILPVAMARLTLDDCRNGLLSRGANVAEMNVVQTEHEAGHKDLGATDYLLEGVKIIPRVSLCVICGSLLASAGFLLMYVPGLVITVITLISTVYVALTSSTHFRGFFGTCRLLIRRPMILLAFFVGGFASLAISFIFSLLFSAIPVTGNLYFNVATSTVTNVLSSFAVAFTTVTVTLLMINTLDRLGYQREDDGFMKILDK